MSGTTKETSKLTIVQKMVWTWISLALAALIFPLQSWLFGRDKRLPPGPRGIPLIGSLHLFGKFPHRDLHQLAQKYGPIMHIRLGLIPTIIASSPQAAELFLKTHDLFFASRPRQEASYHMSYGQKNLTFGQYGPYWRDVRKMCTLELLSNLKINSFKAMRKEELHSLIDYIKELSDKSGAVDLSAKVSALSADMSCRMVFGRKFSADYIPQIAAVDLQGLTKRMKAISKVFDEFFEKIIDDYIQCQDKTRTKDFVDVMLSFLGNNSAEYSLERDNVKAVMLDLLAAAMDTSSTAIEWGLSELMKHPRVMKKLQKELEENVGMDRMVEESDLEKLKYLDMIVKETLRLHPVVPLLIHAPTEDCCVNGFLIPQKSRLIINLWAIGRDPKAWTDADKFRPERFLGSSIDLRGRDFQLIPFGSGRRGCPGMNLGLTVVKLVLSQLVHCFDWELPNGMLPEDLDMTEEFGLVIPRASHLQGIPTYRLHT